jgi:hypothetical protein
MWPINGLAISTATDWQFHPRLVSDGAGGAIITWYTDDGYYHGVAIHAQRVDGRGVVLWAMNGIPIRTGGIDTKLPRIVSDETGGAIIAWLDIHDASSDYDILAQRIDKRGYALWGDSGITVSAGGGNHEEMEILGNGAGGAIATWQNGHYGMGGSETDIYVQRIAPDGTSTWTTGGIAACINPQYQLYPKLASDGNGGAIITWCDARNGNSDVYAQRIERNGYWGYPSPGNLEIKDVPHDQGGKVTVTWSPSRLDQYPNQVVTHYSVWRKLSSQQILSLMKQGLKNTNLSDVPREFKGLAYMFVSDGGESYGWELLTNTDALCFDKYTYMAATPYDSIVGHTGWQQFIVVAHTQNLSEYWKSEPDSGYSVDNLSPGTPKALAGKQEYTPAGLGLTWRSNIEADLGHYAVYRGASAGFVPGAGNLIAAPRDTTLLDSAWRWSSGYYYKVSAIDIHGNESGFALLAPDGVTGTEIPKAPAASYLAQNYPNPFNPMTRIAFGLSAPGHVSLRIYDVTGRLVCVLAEGNRPAANYAEVWEGRDASGRTVASGIYFCRLDASSFTQTRKMILLR